MRLGRGVQGEVRDLDVVVVLVGEDPLGGGDHIGRTRDAAVVHHPHRQDVRGRGSARIAAGTARRDPRHEGAVPVPVTLRVGRGRAEVHLRVGATAEVLLARVEPRVDDRDRRRVRSRMPVRPPEARDARHVGPELVVGLAAAERRRLDLRIGRDRQAGNLRQPHDPFRLQLHRDAVHQRKALRDRAAVGLSVGRERCSSVRRATGSLDDHRQPLTRVRLSLLEQLGRNIRLCTRLPTRPGRSDKRSLRLLAAAAVRKGSERCAESECEHEQDRGTTAAAPPKRARPTLTAPGRIPPESAPASAAEMFPIHLSLHPFRA